MKKALMFFVMMSVVCMATTTAFATFPTEYDGCWIVWHPGTSCIGWWGGTVVFNVSSSTLAVKSTLVEEDGDLATYTTADISAGEGCNFSLLDLSDYTEDAGFTDTNNYLEIIHPDTGNVDDIVALGLAGNGTEGFNAYTCKVRDYTESGHQSTACPVLGYDISGGWWCGHVMIVLPEVVFDTNSSIGWGGPSPGTINMTYNEIDGGTATYEHAAQTGLNQLDLNVADWTDGASGGPSYDTQAIIHAQLSANSGYVLLSFAFWYNDTAGFLVRGVSCAKDD